MLALHIAKIHDKQLSAVNRAINMNRDRFRDNVDVIDLKGKDFTMHLVHSGIFSGNAVNAAKNVYLLSERGYAKLIKIFNDDKSWELYDIMLDEYFDLRDSNVTPMNNKPMTPAEIVMVYAQQFLEQERKLAQVDDKVIRLETEFHKESLKEGYLSNDYIARKLGLFSLSDKPHFQFVDAVAKELRIYNNKAGYEDEYVKVSRDDSMGGIVKAVAYYSDKALGLIEGYVSTKFKPICKYYVRGKNKGEFNESSFELGDKTYKFNESTYKKYQE